MGSTKAAGLPPCPEPGLKSAMARQDRQSRLREGF